MNKRIKIGDLVRVVEGSGIDSSKVGRVVPKRLVTTDGSGIPTNLVSGNYKPLDDDDIIIEFPNGDLISMFKNRVEKIDG